MLSRTFCGIRSSLGIAKSLSTTHASWPFAADVKVDERELEEPDGVGFGNLALHHLARNLARTQIEATAPRALGDGVVQSHLPLPAEQVTRLDRRCRPSRP